MLEVPYMEEKKATVFGFRDLFFLRWKKDAHFRVSQWDGLHTRMSFTGKRTNKRARVSQLPFLRGGYGSRLSNRCLPCLVVVGSGFCFLVMLMSRWWCFQFVVYFHPECLGNDGNLTIIFFKWAGSTTNS